MQPWNVQAVTDDALVRMHASIGQNMYRGDKETPEFPSYLPKMGESCRERRATCKERMYAALGDRP